MRRRWGRIFGGVHRPPSLVLLCRWIIPTNKHTSARTFAKVHAADMLAAPNRCRH